MFARRTMFAVTVGSALLLGGCRLNPYGRGYGKYWRSWFGDCHVAEYPLAVYPYYYGPQPGIPPQQGPPFGPPVLPPPTETEGDDTVPPAPPAPMAPGAEEPGLESPGLESPGAESPGSAEGTDTSFVLPTRHDLDETTTEVGQATLEVASGEQPSPAEPAEPVRVEDARDWRTRCAELVAEGRRAAREGRAGEAEQKFRAARRLQNAANRSGGSPSRQLLPTR